MRRLETARMLARIAGPGAARRYLFRAARVAIAARLDEGAALLLLWRAKILRKSNGDARTPRGP